MKPGAQRIYINHVHAAPVKKSPDQQNIGIVGLVKPQAS
jgi:hypothetical protein